MLASILVSPSPSICAFALVDSHINFNDASTQAHWLDWMCGAIVVLKLAIAQCVRVHCAALCCRHAFPKAKLWHTSVGSFLREGCDSVLGRDQLLLHT